MLRKSLRIALIALGLLVFAAACQGRVSTVEPTPTLTQDATAQAMQPTSTVLPSPTALPETPTELPPTATPTTAAPSETPTEAATNTPTAIPPSATPTEIPPTATPSPDLTAVAHEQATQVAESVAQTLTAQPTNTLPPTDTPAPTLTPSATHTAIPTEAPTLTPTIDLQGTRSANATQQAAFAAAVEATVEALPTSTPYPTHTFVPTDTPAPTLTPSLTPTIDVRGTRSANAADRATLAAAVEATVEALPTGTPYPTHTLIPTGTPAPTLTPSATFTAIPTEAPTLTPTIDLQGTRSANATGQAAFAAAVEATVGALPTSTPYPTYTPIPTDTPAPTLTASPTLTPSATYTAIPTEEPSLTPTIDLQGTRSANATEQAEFAAAVQSAVEGTLAALPTATPRPTLTQPPSPTALPSPTVVTATPVEIALRRTAIEGLGLEFDYPAQWRPPNQLTPFTAVGMPTDPDQVLIVFVRGLPDELVEAGIFSSTEPVAILQDTLYGIESTIAETDRFDEPAWEATGQDDTSGFHYYLLRHGAEWVFVGSQAPLAEVDAFEAAVFEPLVASLTIGAPPPTPTPRPTLEPFVPTPLPTLTPMRFEVTVTRQPTRTPRVPTATPSAVPPTVTSSPAGPTPDLFATATAIVQEATRVAAEASLTGTAIPPSPVVTVIPVTPTETLRPMQLTGTSVIQQATMDAAQPEFTLTPTRTISPAEITATSLIVDVTATAAARELGTPLPPTTSPGQFTATAIIAGATAAAASKGTAEPSATPDLDATATAIVSEATATAAALAGEEFPVTIEVPEGWDEPVRRDANTVFLTDGAAQVFVYAGQRDDLKGLWEIPDDVAGRDDAAELIAQRLEGQVAPFDDENISLILTEGDEMRGAVYLITLPDGDLALVSASAPADEFDAYRADVFDPLAIALAAPPDDAGTEATPPPGETATPAAPIELQTYDSDVLGLSAEVPAAWIPYSSEALADPEAGFMTEIFFENPSDIQEDLPEPNYPAIVLMRAYVSAIAPAHTFSDPSEAISYVFGVDEAGVREFEQGTYPTYTLRQGGAEAEFDAVFYLVIVSETDWVAAALVAPPPASVALLDEAIMQPLVRSIQVGESPFDAALFPPPDESAPAGTPIALSLEISLSQYVDADLGLAYLVPDDWTMTTDQALTARAPGTSNTLFYVSPADAEHPEHTPTAPALGIVRVDLSQPEFARVETAEDLMEEHFGVDRELSVPYVDLEYPAVRALAPDVDTGSAGVIYIVELSATDWVAVLLVAPTVRDIEQLDEMVAQPLVRSLDVRRAPALAPQPTYTPRPTYTPQPTYTPRPTHTPDA